MFNAEKSMKIWSFYVFTPHLHDLDNFQRSLTSNCNQEHFVSLKNPKLSGFITGSIVKFLRLLDEFSDGVAVLKVPACYC